VRTVVTPTVTSGYAEPDVDPVTLDRVEHDDMAREPEAIAELRRSLGARLATFRLAAELTQGQLAKIVICDRTTIAHIEKGRARGDSRFWKAADDACSAGGALLAAYVDLEAAKTDLEQQERNRRLETVRARAAELQVRRSDEASGGHRPGTPQLDELRRALLALRAGDSSEEVGSPNLSQIEAVVAQAHTLYQRADYDGAAQLLPLVINRIEAVPHVKVHTKAVAYLAAAKLATKMGDSGLAWVAADRGLRLANESGRHGIIGVAEYQVACALLGNGHVADAEATAMQAAEHVAKCPPSSQPQPEDVVSVHGALLLLLALIAGRRGNGHVTKKYLRDAARLAERLGQDGNRLWTAFGPTNIAIHELAVRVALGDSRSALELGERIDTDALPAVLRGRRSQVHLELGWASAGQGDDSLAVLHLLEAERVARQSISRNVTAQTLLTTLLARERRSATPGLRALAARAGVA
jgi:transcriptional regulator with XRE-family HTH domain